MTEQQVLEKLAAFKTALMHKNSQIEALTQERDELKEKNAELEASACTESIATAINEIEELI